MGPVETTALIPKWKTNITVAFVPIKQSLSENALTATIESTIF